MTNTTSDKFGPGRNSYST